MDNLEKLTKLGTQDTGQRVIKNGESRETDKIRNTRHRTKGNQEWTI